LLLGSLDTELRQSLPDDYAGLSIASDGVAEVHVVRSTERLTDTLRVFAGRGAGLQVKFRVAAGRRNSLQDLERAMREVTARRGDLVAMGLHVSQIGIDVVANRVRVGVAGLGAHVASDFDADLIEFVDAGGWESVVDGPYGQSTQ
jgi:hypothetical protein